MIRSYARDCSINVRARGLGVNILTWIEIRLVLVKAKSWNKWILQRLIRLIKMEIVDCFLQRAFDFSSREVSLHLQGLREFESQHCVEFCST